MTQKDFLLSALVMLIWGFNFTMIKLGVTEVNPLIMTAARFSLAVIPLVFFVRKPDVAWRYIISYGVVFGVGVWGMASWSITAGVSSGMSSVLLQTNVLFSIVVGIVVYKDVLSKRKKVGVSLALIGLLISILSTNGNVTSFGLMLILISAMSWTLIGVIVKASKVKQAFAFNIWGMLFAPVPLVMLAMLLHGSEVVTQAYSAWDWNTTYAVMFQAYPTTLFGYWVWNKMLIKYPLSTAAPLTLLVPVFGLLSGYVFYNELLSTAQMAACGMFLIGILLIVWAPKVASKPVQGFASQK
ncbi:EamA family transporter [Vibrio sp. SCSIO 43135]|uniref:EamA family transporter n=1 Tax=Vibrio sp. SCSIO 43135 TaxID=2819096 RepID=UPI002075FA44|nr:EamA family transporter [Vibrio sp. SCSIO 43135]USD40001.1 EamA family transporter [Vibrio sp. SCSIO 43135]